MNTVSRNRLIGLAIVLIVVFLLSRLITRHQPVQDEHSIPVSAISVGSASVAMASSAIKPAPPTAGGVAIGSVVSTDTGGIQTQPYRPTETAGTSAENGGAAASAAQTASQTAIAASAPPQAKAPQVHLQPSTKLPTAASKPAAPDRARDRPYVQIGSYSDTGNAQKMLSSLQQKGFHGLIDTVTIKGKIFHRVRVGPYDGKPDAAKAQGQLAARGFKHTRIVSGGS